MKQHPSNGPIQRGDPFVPVETQASTAVLHSLQNSLTGRGQATGPRPLLNLFSQLDGASLSAKSDYAGTAKTVQVGIPGGSAGAVSIQAHLAAGQVSATIQVERDPAMHLLARELPAMQQFLAASHVDIKQISIDLSHRGDGQAANSGREDAGSQSPEGQPSEGEAQEYQTSDQAAPGQKPLSEAAFSKPDLLSVFRNGSDGMQRLSVQA